MDQRLKNKLVKRREEGTMRSLSLFQDHIDFISNDYLGFAKLSKNVQSHSGSGGSRLLAGNSKEAVDCESFLANFFDVESALVFNSGYNANLSLFGSVPQRGDTILHDEYIHASVRDGVRLSFAKNQSFNHNDLQDLENKIIKAEGAIYVAVESLYSMGGDLAPLGKTLSLCEKYGAYLIVDEAHAVGVFGDKGKGIVDILEEKAEIFARLITFGKALGSHGAAVLCSEELKAFLVNFARPFIYSTAMPPSAYEQIVEIMNHPELCKRRIDLQENLSYFTEQMKEDRRLISESNSPIQMLQIGSVQEVKSLEKVLQESKIAAKAILSPTVKVGEEGLRLCFHAFNSKKEIDQLVRYLLKN
jgi:8-amino-7-oxononanoate synthase